MPLLFPEVSEDRESLSATDANSTAVQRHYCECNARTMELAIQYLRHNTRPGYPSWHGIHIENGPHGKISVRVGTEDVSQHIAEDRSPPSMNGVRLCRWCECAPCYVEDEEFQQDLCLALDQRFHKFMPSMGVVRILVKHLMMEKLQSLRLTPINVFPVCAYDLLWRWFKSEGECDEFPENCFNCNSFPCVVDDHTFDDHWFQELEMDYFKDKKPTCAEVQDVLKMCFCRDMFPSVKEVPLCVKLWFRNVFPDHEAHHLWHCMGYKGRYGRFTVLLEKRMHFQRIMYNLHKPLHHLHNW